MELVHQGAGIRGRRRVPVHGAHVAGLGTLGGHGGGSHQGGEVFGDVRGHHANQLHLGGSPVVNILF